MINMGFEKNFELIRSLDYRRYFIPLLGLTYLLFLNNNYDNYYILSFVVFLDSIIILSNFTFLVIWSNAKPLYYEDLYIDVKKLPLLPLDSRRKKIYKTLYTRILVISNSLLISALVCYWKSKSNRMNSYIEILGVTGGLIEMASCFNHISGKLALFLIKKFINIQISSSNSFNELEENDNNLTVSYPDQENIDNKAIVSTKYIQNKF
jgi:hypothetical protein